MKRKLVILLALIVGFNAVQAISELSELAKPQKAVDTFPGIAQSEADIAELVTFANDQAEVDALVSGMTGTKDSVLSQVARDQRVADSFKQRKVERVVKVKGFRDVFVTMYEDDCAVVKWLKGNLNLEVVQKNDDLCAFLFFMPHGILDRLPSDWKIIPSRKAYYEKNGVICDSLSYALSHDILHFSDYSYRAMVDYCCPDFTEEQRRIIMNEPDSRDKLENPELEEIFDQYWNLFVERVRCYTLMQNQEFFDAIEAGAVLDKELFIKLAN